LDRLREKGDDGERCEAFLGEAAQEFREGGADLGEVVQKLVNVRAKGRINVGDFDQALVDDGLGRDNKGQGSNRLERIPGRAKERTAAKGDHTTDILGALGLGDGLAAELGENISLELEIGVDLPDLVVERGKGEDRRIRHWD
jgi:hypothetical protein